ncbi:hypothetical protein EJ03DRAFT_351864 [Teratosphaeria nubilosa]|uniref:Actin-like ATPase domain-containing protein n=1 Tax=Teratosphaeria nubilosa TaxID=161662 RepID=A0A6G1L9E6_9PEZI|nr:hypothetical protein EJ03DRAFT_351864 [Teratosphaeria nubilosa]
MAQHLVERLEPIQDHLQSDVLTVADEMMMARFQTVKHSFPNPVVDQVWLDVKGLAGAQDFPEAGIKQSRMSIDRAVLTEIFDQQVEQIFDLMDERLRILEENHPAEQVAYIILSGGLGSSPYLHEEMKKRYQMNYGFRSRNTSSVRIMGVLEPQLAVVRGLVRERTQQLGVSPKIGQEVFTTRRCRNSYGVVVNARYDESRHRGQPTFYNAYSQATYVPSAIEWFIRQGQEINVKDGFRREWTKTLADGEHLIIAHAS